VSVVSNAAISMRSARTEGLCLLPIVIEHLADLFVGREMKSRRLMGFTHKGKDHGSSIAGQGPALQQSSPRMSALGHERTSRHR